MKKSPLGNTENWVLKGNFRPADSAKVGHHSQPFLSYPQFAV